MIAVTPRAANSVSPALCTALGVPVLTGCRTGTPACEVAG